MADRFYVNCPLAPGPIRIEGPEAHHLTTVCRLRPGDPVCLFNGDAHEYPALVKTIARRMVDVEVLAVEFPQRELGFRVEVAAPLPKGDRAQLLIEKLTELGVTTFVPLETERSIIRPREGKLDKLRRYVIEASKQCGRNVLMHVDALIDWHDYCRRDDLPAVRLVAHPGGKKKGEWQKRCDTALAVGPEGGFTDDEIELAAGFGWQVVGLGPRILRIETAALLLVAWASRAGNHEKQD